MIWLEMYGLTYAFCPFPFSQPRFVGNSLHVQRIPFSIKGLSSRSVSSIWTNYVSRDGNLHCNMYVDTIATWAALHVLAFIIILGRRRTETKTLVKWENDRWQHQLMSSQSYLDCLQTPKYALVTENFIERPCLLNTSCTICIFRLSINLRSFWRKGLQQYLINIMNKHPV